MMDIDQINEISRAQLHLLEQVLADMDGIGSPWEVRGDYSGRDMRGRKCLAFVGPSRNLPVRLKGEILISIFGIDTNAVSTDEFWWMLNNLQQMEERESVDNLGHDYVVYYTDIRVADDEDEQ